MFSLQKVCLNSTSVGSAWIQTTSNKNIDKQIAFTLNTYRHFPRNSLVKTL